MRENDFLYSNDTKVKDLTVGELKDIIMECLLSSKGYQSPLNCVGKELNYSTYIDVNTENTPKL